MRLSTDPKGEKENEGHLDIKDATQVLHEGSSVVHTSGTSSFTMSDEAQMDITHTAQVFIHDGAIINMDVEGENDYWTPEMGIAIGNWQQIGKHSSLFIHNQARIIASGGAALTIGETASGNFNGHAYFRAGAAKIVDNTIKYTEPHIIFNTGNFNLIRFI